MKNKIILNLTMLGFILTGAVAHAHDTSNAKAAELSLHRIERLVILHRIPDTFMTNLSSVAIAKLTQTQPSDPFFESIISQVAASDTTQKKTHILMDDDGRALSFTQDNGGDSANPPVWPAKDSVSLLEYSLHCLQGELIGTSTLCQTTTDLRDYEANMTTATLTQTNVAGAVVGEVTILKTGGSATAKAIIRFNADGTLATTNPIEVIP